MKKITIEIILIGIIISGVILMSRAIELTEYKEQESPIIEKEDLPEYVYETDRTTVDMNIWSPTGTLAAPGWLLAPGDYIYATIYISNYVDPTREIKFYLIWYEGDDLTIEGDLSLWKDPCDGLTGTITIDNAINHDITFQAQNTFIDSIHTLSEDDIELDALYTLGWSNVEAVNSIYLNKIQVEFYLKRPIS